ncbi:MAG TPA: hypothetical protein P5323_00795 [Candidatus Moranbacteria bacterium]|nr:hypothetical protein [Candidatus Moranbacteria bacterium]HRY27652.1 hypothetical protein [Candidatus Moranbacteria bacterium]HSA08025.1 hypothetical protein [Candidatus Moranbacteria bacterium]
MIKISKKILFPIIFLSGFLMCQKAEAAYCTGSESVWNCTVTTLTDEGVVAVLDEVKNLTGEVTVNLPAGTYNFDADVSINMSSDYTNVSILIIKGAGSKDVGNTIISDPRSVAWNHESFNVTMAENKIIRFTGLKFLGKANPIYITGNSSVPPDGGFAVDNNIFYKPTTSNDDEARGVLIRGTKDLYGVIANNKVDWNGQLADYAGTYSSAYGQGNNKHIEPIPLGTFKAVYLEGNIARQYGWHGGSEVYNFMLCDTGYGASLVGRYNTMTHFHWSGHDSSTSRSQVSWDIHNNDISSSTNYTPGAIAGRGGTGVIYNNNVRVPIAFTNGNQGISFILDRLNNGGVKAPWGNYKCDGTVYYVCLGEHAAPEFGTSPYECNPSDPTACNNHPAECQAMDGNEEPETAPGYPCRDQVGMGPDDPVTGEPTRYPALLWNNWFYKGNDDPVPAHVDISSAIVSYWGAYAVEGRDFCHGDGENHTTMPTSCSGIATTYSPEPTCPHPLLKLFGYSGSCDLNVIGAVGYNIISDDIIAPAAPSGLAVS